MSQQQLEVTKLQPEPSGGGNGHDKIPAHVPPAPEPVPPERAESRGTGPAAFGWDAIAPTLVTVVTGAGLLGFVALFGGAILFARAEEAGLPAAEAVSLLPKSSLLATGGEFLVAAMLLALVAVAGLWLLGRFLDPVAERVWQRRLGEASAKTREGHGQRVSDATAELERSEAESQRASQQVEAWTEVLKDVRVNHSAAQTRLDAASRAFGEARATADPVEIDLLSGTLQGLDRENAEGAVRRRDEAKATRDAAALDLRAQLERVNEAEAACGRASKDAAAASTGVVKRERELAAATEAQTRFEETFKKRLLERIRLTRYVLLCVGLLIGEVIFLMPGGLTAWHVLGLLLVSAVTSFLAVLVYHHTAKFHWFGVAAFLAMGVFQGWALHYSIQDSPKVEPAVALIAGQTPLAGTYVTQTKDRLYMGLPADDAGSAFVLVGVPRDTVRALAVGPMSARTGASQVAGALKSRLCERQPVGTSIEELRAAPQCPKTVDALEARVKEADAEQP